MLPDERHFPAKNSLDKHQTCKVILIISEKRTTDEEPAGYQLAR